ncbi:peptidase M23 [Rossellomorea aquimaris]|nr:peptidase M23 [Rossellomorea aquimaris]
MSEALRTIFLTVLFAFITAMQFNLDADKTATRELKNAVEIAVHDASLALDEAQLRDGKLVFDQVQARQNFRDGLMSYMDLDSALTPNPTSFYQDEVVLEYIEFVDDSNATFPMTYTNPTYNIVDTLNGPSIIVVVTTTSPRYFAGDPIQLRKAAVYGYFY